MKHQRIINSLWDLSEHITPISGAKLISGIIYKNKLICIGFNQRKSHPIQKEFSKNENAIYLHAEIDAIIQARRQLTLDELKNSTLIILRRKMKLIKGGWGNYHTPCYGEAHPCSGCMKAIKNFNIGEVIYSKEEDSFVRKFGVIER